MKAILIVLIRLYQKTLSPDHGLLRGYFPFGVCRFEVTCSDYCWQEIEKRGWLKALPFCLKRIISCQPWGRSVSRLAGKPVNR